MYKRDGYINNDGIFYIGDTQNNVNETGIIVADLLPGEEIVSEIQIPIEQYRPNGNSDYKIIPSCRLLKIKGVSVSSVVWTFAMEIVNRPRSLHFTGWKDTKTACWIEEVKVHMKGLGWNTVKDEYGQTKLVEDQFVSLPTKGGESLKILPLLM